MAAVRTAEGREAAEGAGPRRQSAVSRVLVVTVEWRERTRCRARSEGEAGGYGSTEEAGGLTEGAQVSGCDPQDSRGSSPGALYLRGQTGRWPAGARVNWRLWLERAVDQSARSVSLRGRSFDAKLGRANSSGGHVLNDAVLMSGAWKRQHRGLCFTGMSSNLKQF